jgi:Polysaccharide deacetylase
MLTVANYHYIRENFNTKYPSIFGVTPKQFRNQLLLLKDKGDFVHPNELILNHDEILNSKNNFFFITYDDGLKEQYKYALPILDELKIPAAFFANSRNFLDKKLSNVHKIHLLRSIVSPSDFLSQLSKHNNAIQLSQSDIAKAQSIYIYDDKKSASLKYLLNFKINFTIQEYLINAIFVNYFNENDILGELYMSENEIIDLSKKGKQFFENLTNSKIEMVAYPYGTPEACTNEVAKMANEVAYKLGFTTTRGINTKENNLLLLNRFDCNDLSGGKKYKK